MREYRFSLTRILPHRDRIYPFILAYFMQWCFFTSGRPRRVHRKIFLLTSAANYSFYLELNSIKAHRKTSNTKKHFYSIAICGCLKCLFLLSGSFGFFKHLINVYLLKKVYINSYCISSNKRPRRLLNFETLRCRTH